MKKILLISLLVFLNVLSEAQDNAFTISAGIGAIGRGDDVGGSRLLPVKLNWLLSDYFDSKVKMGASLGYEHWKMKALDGTNVSRFLTLNLFDIGVIYDPIGLPYISPKAGAIIGSGYMKDVGNEVSVYFLYLGLRGFLNFNPVYIEYGINRQFNLGGDTYGNFNDPRYNVISFPQFRIDIAIHFAFLTI